MKTPSLNYTFLLLTILFISCGKQDYLSPQLVPEVKISHISFEQDTIPVILTVTSARKENVGSLFATAIDGKLPDSILLKNSLIIRVTGDSTGIYSNMGIFAGYTDSLGNSFANDIADTINVVRITRIENRRDGIVEGSFTIRVSNSTKTKTLLLNNGKFSTAFLE